jgi:predicted nucleic acid-binding protein
MSVLVDTAVLIDVLRGLESARAALRVARQEGVVHSSVVVRAEVLAGMRPDEQDATMGLLDTVQWHEVTREVADEAGRLGRQWHPSHRGIDTADLLIAATAVGLGLSLLTTNVRHYPMFPDLTSPY